MLSLKRHRCHSIQVSGNGNKCKCVYCGIPQFDSLGQSVGMQDMLECASCVSDVHVHGFLGIMRRDLKGMPRTLALKGRHLWRKSEPSGEEGACLQVMLFVYFDSSLGCTLRFAMQVHVTHAWFI
eukprot:4794873-Amphidinium_carterae.1